MTCTNLPPRTGQQFSISHGDYHAVVTELGATLRKLTYQGEDIIVSPGPDDMVTCCHGQLLIPFPNRIENGEYTFEGKTYTLPIDEHERHNAIHGYGKRAFWKLVSLKEDAVTLSWRAPNMEGYPFDIVVTATYSLADDGLHLNISAYNNGDADAPWALAIHPWLANGFNGYGDEIDAHNAKCSLTVPGRTHVTVNENLIPTGTEPVDGTKYDLRKDTLLTEQPFDDAWTDLEHAEDGTVRTARRCVWAATRPSPRSRCAPAPVSRPSSIRPAWRWSRRRHTRMRSTPARTSSSSSRARRQARRCSSGCSTDIITIGISPGHTADAEFGKRLARVR